MDLYKLLFLQILDKCYRNSNCIFKTNTSSVYAETSQIHFHKLTFIEISIQFSGICHQDHFDK